MNIHKKALPFVLAVSIIVGTLGGTPAYAASEEQDDNSGGVFQTFNSDKFKYTITGDNAETKEVEIDGWTNEYLDEGRNNADSIIIPSTVTNGNTEFSVTSIARGAFFHCINLEKVTVGMNISKIEQSFEECDNLNEIIVAEGNTKYFSEGGVLFEKDKPNNGSSEAILVRYPAGKEGQKYTIPNNVTNVKFNAFQNCRNLQDVTIPESVTSADNAFSNFKNLRNIEVDINNETYSSKDGVLFKNETEGTGKKEKILVQYPEGKTDSTYTIPNDVTNIGISAFSSSTDLSSVTIPTSVTGIGSQAFYNCQKLEEITVENKNTKYFSEEGILFEKDEEHNETILVQYPAGKTDNQSYDIPDNVTSISKWAFSYCNNFSNITIPNSVTHIGEFAFDNCGNLQDITIPNSVESIEPFAFLDCVSLQQVTIENGVINIGELAFDHCDSLQDVTIPNSVTSIGEDAFSDCPDSLTLIVEKGSYAEQYANNNGIHTSIDSDGFPQVSTIDEVTQAIEALHTNPTSELVNTAVELAENLPVDQRKKLLEDNVETVKELESAIKQVNKNVQTEVSEDPGPFADNDSAALQDVQAVGLLLATGATDNNSISVQLTEKQEEPLSGEKLRFDLTLTKTAGDETQELHENLPFPVQITLMLPSGFVYHADRHYEIRHTLQEKTETLPMTITGEPGHYTAVFLTNSFSTFSLMETGIDDSNGDDDNDEDNNKPSNPITQPSNQSQTFASDTTGDFAVNGSYQFKITSKNGKAPVFVVGTPGVFEIQSVTRNGNDYFFGLKAIGAPGDKAGIYVNGIKLLVTTVGSNPNYVKLDTGNQLSVRAGKTYQFRVTAAKRPTFVCGTGSTFRVAFAGSKGNDYFFKVNATGKVGDRAGFYVNSEKTPRTIGTIIS